MKNWLLAPLILLMSLHAQASIKAYFNHNPNASYTDPYRGTTRLGDDLEQVLLDQIKKAKKSIYIAAQEIRLPLVAAALIDKKTDNPDIDIRVVIEHDYNFTVLTQRDQDTTNEHESTRLTELHALVDVNKDGKFSPQELGSRDAIYMLRQALIPIMDDTSDGSMGAGLMHHKFMIVDGKSTVMTTANFTLSCIHGDILAPRSKGNANSMVVVQSIELSKIFTDEFLQMWGNGVRGNFGQKKTYRGAQTVMVRGSKVTVQFSPTSSRFMWAETVNGLITSHLEKATTSVKAALFVFSDQAIANALEKRSDLGVSMGFLIEPKFAFREYSELLDMMGLHLLSPTCKYENNNRPWKKPIAEAGIPLLERGDVLHHKFAVVDNKTVIVGSQNWSESANFTNDETLMVIQNKTVSELYTQEYERLKSRSRLGPTASLEAEIRRTETECALNGFYF